MITAPFVKKHRRSRRRRLAPTQIYGKTFPFLGQRFAPIRHNWLYGFPPESIIKWIDQQGLEKTVANFKGILGPPRPHLTYLSQEEEFREDILPRYHEGLTGIAAYETADFLAFLFFLGWELGFDKKILYFIIANIANTELVSLLYQEYADKEVTGNSIFSYTIGTIFMILLYKQGWKSQWYTWIIAFLQARKYFLQFSVPASNKPMHLYGGLWAFLSLHFIWRR